MSDWSRLLAEESQPASMRECYELLEDFVGALRGPAPRHLVTSLREDQRARLGYLIAAATMIGGAEHDPSWSELLQRLVPPRPEDAASALVLLACDEGDNPADELARRWGLRKGLDTLKLVQLASHGAA